MHCLRRLQDSSLVSLVLELNHILDSSVAVVDIHSADLRVERKEVND